MAKWKSKSFKMSVGDKEEGAGSFSRIGEQMAQTSKYSKEEDPAEKLLNHVYDYLEKPKVIEERSAHRAPGLHASSLHSTCARREILIAIALMVSKATLVIEPERHTAGNTFTQDLGHALHDWWQNRYLGPAGLLYGLWRCQCGTVEGLQPHQCETCKRHFRYQEYSVHVKDDLDIHGHCDGVVLDMPGMTSSKRRVFELKTKSSTQYPTIHAPERKHVIQVHTYMKGLGLDEAIIIYVNKDKQCSWRVKDGQFIAGKPKIKSFLVPFDDELWGDMESLVREYHDAQQRIKDVSEGKADPSKVYNPNDFTQVCDSIKCSMARSCAVKDLCFSV